MTRGRLGGPLMALLLGWAAAAPGLAEIPEEETLRQFVESIDAGAPAVVMGEPLLDPAGLAEFYTQGNHAYVWSRSGPLADQLDELLQTIVESGRHGLQPRHYHERALRELTRNRASGSELSLELLATDAFLAQANHRSSGAVSPHALYPDWHLIPPEVNAAELLAETAGLGASVTAALNALWPEQAEYQALVAERARIDALHEEIAVSVPPGPLLKPGQSGERVRLLQHRLLGPNDHSGVYDEPLRVAVAAFQQSVGLEPDGIVGPATLEMLNANRFSWIERIDANLERWRWLPREEPDTYLRVNIPAFTLRAVDDGRTALSMNVIVGRPYRRTPVFAADLRYLVVNPFWNVPFRLAVEDKLPQLRNDPSVLAAQGFEVRGPDMTAFAPVDAVTWTGITRSGFNFQLRQRPGPKNALGSVKFMLPNPYAVYLHDTPSRDLFAKQERSFSSGCVRLSDPAALAVWLLNRDGQPDAATRYPELVASGSTVTLHLNEPLPVYIVYFTAFADETGTVVFRRDLYQRDAAIVVALRREPGLRIAGAVVAEQ